MMKWEHKGSSLEIRTKGELSDGRPALDEIVAYRAYLHLEQMTDIHWWMGIEAAGKTFALEFGVDDGRLWVRLTDVSGETEILDGDDRPSMRS